MYVKKASTFKKVCILLPVAFVGMEGGDASDEMNVKCIGSAVLVPCVAL